MKAVMLGNTRLGYSWFYLTYKQGLQLNDVDVYDIDYKSTPLSKIKNQLLALKPALVFTHLTFHSNINPIDSVLQMYSDVSKQVGTRFIHTCNDARTEDRYMGDVSHAYYMGIVGTFDMQKNCEKAWGIPVHYVPYSSLVYCNIAKPVQDLAFKEAVFTGSPGAHKDRQDFLHRLGQRIPIKIFQTQSANDLRFRTPELAMSAKCILGLCTGYDIPGYIDVRPFQYLGAGACMIMRKFWGMDDLIPDSLYYSITSYGEDGVVEAVDHYHRILKEDTSEMKRAAFGYIQRFHSCKVRIAEVLKKIERGV